MFSLPPIIPFPGLAYSPLSSHPACRLLNPELFALLSLPTFRLFHLQPPYPVDIDLCYPRCPSADPAPPILPPQTTPLSLDSPRCVCCMLYPCLPFPFIYSFDCSYGLFLFSHCVSLAALTHSIVENQSHPLLVSKSFVSLSHGLSVSYTRSLVLRPFLCLYSPPSSSH